MDKIIRATAGDGMIKMAVITARDTVQRAREIHNCSPTASAALGRTLCAASFGCAKRVFETNMLEEEKSELEIKDGKVCLEFRPFEIKTILVEY